MGLSFSTGEIVLLAILLVVAALYIFKLGPFANKQEDPWGSAGYNEGGALAALAAGEKNGGAPDTRDLREAMETTGKHIAVFFASQTGTAEDLAVRYAREIKSTFGKGVLVCDLEDYDYDTLDNLPSDALLVFMIATYGEGEPTDNGAEFQNFITNRESEFSQGGADLSRVNFQLFALGNSTYEYFCKAGRDIDEALINFGAQRIGERGEGDDDKRMEDYYLTWKDEALAALTNVLGWDASAHNDVIDFKINDADSYNPNSIYQGELSQRMLLEATDPEAPPIRLAINGKNPLNAIVEEAHELFVQDNEENRHCVHVSLNIADSGLRYQTGDHVAIWPMNSDENVLAFAETLGIKDKLDTPVDIISLDPQLSKVPFPSPTTYGAAIRYYLDISQLAGRQSLGALAAYAPTEEAQERLRRASRDPQYYDAYIGRQSFTLASALAWSIDPQSPNKVSEPINIPFDRLISVVPRLQPRYYSISSSPKLYPDNIHITCVVDRWQSELPLNESQGLTREMFGVGSNYLLAVKNKLNNETSSSEALAHYKVDGPRGYFTRNDKVHIPIHVRHSTFRLPTNPKTPVIMVGPGTGVAPFRGFVQERVALAKKTVARNASIADWGVMRLYYGCRYFNKDFLYRDEWTEYGNTLGDKFAFKIALSRDHERAPRQYVQDLLREDADTIHDAITKQGGYFYICGDAKHMAREVEALLEDILSRDGQDGAKALKSLKDRGRYQTDVWS